jgi:hypothetical protein
MRFTRSEIGGRFQGFLDGLLAFLIVLAVAVVLGWGNSVNYKRERDLRLSQSCAVEADLVVCGDQELKAVAIEGVVATWPIRDDVYLLDVRLRSGTVEVVVHADYLASSLLALEGAR